MAPAARCYRDGQCPALTGEFDRIVAEIIKHLVDGILVAAHKEALLCRSEGNIKVALLNSLFICDQDQARHLADIKGREFEFSRTGLQTGKVKQLGHKSGKAADLIGNYAEIIIMLFLGDRTACDPLNKAKDGGHWRAQIVRNIGNKGITHGFQLFQRIRHLVKGYTKRGDLVMPDDRHAAVKAPLGKPFGHCVHFTKRAGHTLAEEIQDDNGTENDPKA